MGARISKIKVSKKGGSVHLSKTNFLITLAPYFFPLYTVLVIVGYYVLTAFYDLSTYTPFWLSLIGFTWGFHLTFTITTLMLHQSDIQESGRVFSYAVIVLFNLLGLCLWIVAVGTPTLQDLETLFRDHSLHLLQLFRDGTAHLAPLIHHLRPGGGSR